MFLSKLLLNGNSLLEFYTKKYFSISVTFYIELIVTYFKGKIDW